MMIERIEKFLKRVGVLSPFSEDDMINASIEDKYREHEGLVHRLQGTLHRRLITNENLRESIRIAKERTNSFAEFERTMIRREGKSS